MPRVTATIEKFLKGEALTDLEKTTLRDAIDAEESGEAATVITRTAAQGAPTSAVDAAFVGQDCRVGDAVPYAWYKASTAGVGTSSWQKQGGPPPLYLTSAPVDGPGTAGVNQTETLTLSGTITTSGNAQLGSISPTLLVSFAVLAGDTAAQVLDKYIVAAQARPELTEHTFVRSGNTLTITRLGAPGNNAAMEFSYITGTSAGISNTNSVNGVTGVAAITPTDAEDGQLVRVSTVLGAAPFTDYICRRPGALSTVSFSLVRPVAATQAEMEAGTEAAARTMSPLRVAQAILELGGGPLDNAGVVAALSSGGTVTLSQSGGASKIAQYDADGNLRLGFFRTDASAARGGTSNLTGYDGNMLMADDKFLAWMASDLAGGGNYAIAHLGKIYASIRYDRSHDATGGEWNFDAQNRVCWYWNRGFQIGNAQGGSHYMYFHSGTATVGAPMKQSVPVMFNTSSHNGTTATQDVMGIQARPLDTSGNNPELAFYRGMTQDTGIQDQDATSAQKIASITKAGIWTPGTAPAFDTLGDGATVTQVCSRYKSFQVAKVQLGGNRTLAITGAEAGMRGVIYVRQPNSGSARTLTLPTNSAAPASWTAGLADLSTTNAAYDRLAWEFDGTYFFWTVTKEITTPLDADASSFLGATRANISDVGQRLALNDLVLQLKQSNVDATGTLWSKFSVIYPFIGGTATPHSKNLKTDTFNITWVNNNAARHTADGVTGDVASSFYGNTGFAMNNLGQNSAFIYAYSKTQTMPVDGTYFLGATNGVTSRVQMLANTVANNLESSLNSAGTGAFSNGADWRKHFAIDRSNSSNYDIFINAAKTTITSASATPWTSNIFLFARNGSESPANYSPVNLAMVAFGSALSDAEYAEFRTIVTAYQTALGRANP